jgi:hypothetical protein
MVKVGLASASHTSGVKSSGFSEIALSASASASL